MHPESSTVKYLKSFKCRWFLLPVVLQQRNYPKASLIRSDGHVSLLLGFFNAKILPLAVEVIQPLCCCCVAAATTGLVT